MHRHTDNKKTKSVVKFSLPMVRDNLVGMGGLKCKVQAQLRHGSDLSQILIIIEKESEK